MKNKPSYKPVIKHFNVFKEGHTTDGPVTIVSIAGEPFDKEKKIELFVSLGYTVSGINGEKLNTPIKSGMRKFNAPRNWHLFSADLKKLVVAGLSKKEADVLIKEFPSLVTKQLMYL